jgi:tetratricopeptide (TPR) repeat protein
VRRGSPLKYEFLKDDSATAATFKAVRIIGANGSVDAPHISADDLTPYELLTSGKVEEAMARYRQIQKETPRSPSVDEGRFLADAYNLGEEGKLAEAIALLKVAEDLYPKSVDVQDNLAEAYERNGQKDLAIATYKKSLELNPQDANAREKLKKLRGQ